MDNVTYLDTDDEEEPEDNDDNEVIVVLGTTPIDRSFIDGLGRMGSD